MPHDVLAPFRRPGSVCAVTLDAPVPTCSGYSAFATAQGAAKPMRLEIRPPGDGLTISRLYSGLAEIAYDRAGYTVILLGFTSKRIRLRGRNLRPVIEALLAGTCEYVAELEEGAQLPEDGKPVIEHIDLMLPASASPPSSLENP